MALTPSVSDPNRKDVLGHIKKLETKGTAEAEDKLKEEFNMGDKSNIAPATAAQAAAVQKSKT